MSALKGANFWQTLVSCYGIIKILYATSDSIIEEECGLEVGSVNVIFNESGCAIYMRVKFCKNSALQGRLYSAFTEKGGSERANVNLMLKVSAKFEDCTKTFVIEGRLLKLNLLPRIATEECEVTNTVVTYSTEMLIAVTAAVENS